MSRLGPGLAASVGIALVATLLGHVVPIVGAPVAAIVLGIAVRALWTPPASVLSGIAWSGKLPLQAAIVLLGTSISLAQVAHVGLGTLPLIVVTMTLCLVAAVLVGRWLGMSSGLRTLIGVGTAVCGASAIAAVAPVIAASELEIALALATVFLYNVIAVFVFPAIGHALGMGDLAFGTWAGTAINDTSSVVAASYAYSHPAGDTAVVVKLTRATTIVAIVLALALAKRERGVAWWRTFPPFLPWFLLACALQTFGLIPAPAHGLLTAAGLFCIAVALAAIGLQTDAARFARAGARPLALGAVLWLIVATSSLAVQGQFSTR